MPALRELQQAFGASLRSEDDDVIYRHIIDGGFTAAERLRIYGNTCRSTLTETLRMTYPAVERLVGNEFFDMAAQQFIRAHPARTGYLNAYGDGFAGFLAALGPASAVPYLADVARLEWALNVAANAVDAPALAPDALAALDPECHAMLRFEPHPSLGLLALVYPADQIADAVLSGDDAAIGEIDLSGGPVWLAVHRGRAGVEAQRLERKAYDFISELCAGKPLGALVEAAPAHAARLLAEQLAKGRLAGVNVGVEGAKEEDHGE
jgi:Putative DNA-binding domain